MKDSARDEKVGRMLAQAFRTRVGATPLGACPDAETLAAWSDEALTARERASVDAHLADCARCQAQLAAMVRMTSAEPIAETRSVSLWRWLVPAASAAAAAVAVAVWVSIEPAPLPASREASAQLQTPAPAAPAAEPPPARDETAMREAFEKRVDRPAARAGAKASAAPRPEPPALDSIAARKPEQDVARERALARPESVGQQRERQSGDARTFTARPAPPAAAPAPAAALAESVAAAPFEIVSPDPAVRWRVRSGSLIEPSADGGTTWGTPTFVTQTQFTAGASPTPSVAWLVGRGGVVMLSIDGRNWRRVSFPEAVDLVGVTASSGTTASVTTADGRTLTTSDAGATWR